MNVASGTAQVSSIVERLSESFTAPAPQFVNTFQSRVPFPIITVGVKKYFDPENPSGSEANLQSLVRALVGSLDSTGTGMTLAIPGYELDALALRIEHPAAEDKLAARRKPLLRPLRNAPTLSFAHTSYSEDDGFASELLEKQYEFGLRAARHARVRTVPLATVPRSAAHRLDGLLSYMHRMVKVDALVLQRPIRRSPVLAPDLSKISSSEQYVFMRSAQTVMPALIGDTILKSVWERHMSGSVSSADTAKALGARANSLQDAGQKFGVLLFGLDRLGSHNDAVNSNRDLFSRIADQSEYIMTGFDSSYLAEISNSRTEDNTFNLNGKKPLELMPSELSYSNQISREQFSARSPYAQVLTLIRSDRGFSKAFSLARDAESTHKIYGATSADCKRQQRVANIIDESLRSGIEINDLVKSINLEDEILSRQLKGIHLIALNYVREQNSAKNSTKF